MKDIPQIEQPNRIMRLVGMIVDKLNWHIVTIFLLGPMVACVAIYLVAYYRGATGLSEQIILFALGLLAMGSPFVGFTIFVLVVFVIPMKLEDAAWKHGTPTNGLPKPVDE